MAIFALNIIHISPPIIHSVDDERSRRLKR